MLEFLRKHQHGIMIVVAFVVIIAFVWFFNPYDARSGNLNATSAVTVGNKSVSLKEVQRQQRILAAANTLGFSFTMQLLQPTFDVLDFTQNRQLMRQEARKLGIEPTEDDVLAAIGAHPSFQTSGKFDQSRYDDAIANTLQPAGLQPGDLRSLVADKLILEKLDELLGSNSSAPSSLVNVQYQATNEKISASVIDFKLADFESKVEINDEALKAYYDELQSMLPSEDKRVIVSELSEEQKASMEVLLSEETRDVEFVFFEQPAAPTLPPGDPGALPPIPGAGGQSFQIPNPNSGGVPQTIEIPSPSTGGGAPPTINLNPDAGNTPTIEIPQIEIPGATDTEAEPPGQAPLEEATGELSSEPLPAPPNGDLNGLDVDLTPADELQGDVNVGGLTTEIPAVPEEGSLSLPGNPLGTQPEPMLGDVPSITSTDAMASATNAAEEHEQKMRAYEKLVDDFYNKLIDTENPSELEALADEAKLTVEKSGSFTQNDPPASPRMVPELITAIFKAQAENDGGVMVPVEGQNPPGFYVIKILNAQEPQELSFADANDALKKAYTKKRAAEMMNDAAEAAREKLTVALANGTSFGDAAKANGLEARKVDEFTLNKRPTGEANATQLLEAVRTTTTGSVSEVTEALDDVMLVSVTQRVAAPETKPTDTNSTTPSPGNPPAVDPEAEKTKLAERLDQQSQRSAFGLWLANRREAVGVSRNAGIAPIIYFPYGNRF